MRLDPADFRLDGDGTDTDVASTPTVLQEEAVMEREEIEELKVAVQEAIALGASPEAMQKINDFINKKAEPTTSARPAVGETPTVAGGGKPAG